MIGQKLGSFQIESKLGAGAMGVVYKGTNVNTGRPAAIKLITTEYAQRGNAAERFKRESEILQQFRHPNIVRLLAVGRYQGTAYFAMEYVAGKTLETMLEEKECVPWLETVDLSIQTCEALQYAHERGVVHRDLKPSNLMINEEGQIKLADFGIAKDLDATALTDPGRTLGTAAYMAPEQIRGTPEVSHKTDLYALGILMFQMLTGKPPFSAGSVAALMHAHLTAVPPRVSDKNPEIPKALDDLVFAMMAKDPTARPWDAQAVEQTLRDLRDKASRNEAIAMVRAEMPTVDIGKSTSKSSKQDLKSKKKRKSSKEFPITRGQIETASLVALLLIVGGAIAYFLWPPSAGYLVKQAEPLMASTQYSDWITAKTDYLDELERRFPDHPYREKTEPWLDRIAIEKARSRAGVIENRNLTSFSRPKGQTEQMYYEVFEKVAQESKEHRDVEAVKVWRGLADALKNDRAERGWYLLARERADQLDKKIDDRRAEVERQLKHAEDLVINGRLADANRVQEETIKEFEKYPELSDMIMKAKTELAARSPKPPAESGDEATKDKAKPKSEAEAEAEVPAASTRADAATKPKPDTPPKAPVPKPES